MTLFELLEMNESGALGEHGAGVVRSLSRLKQNKTLCLQMQPSVISVTDLVPVTEQNVPSLSVKDTARLCDG